VTQMILMPTLKCDAACRYCFQTRTSGYLSHEQLAHLLEQLGKFMDERGDEEATIYWLGGEALCLEPEWYMRALDSVRQWENRQNKKLINRLQTNLMGYDKRWNTVIAEMFANEVGSSLDYPNLYRTMAGSTPEAYNQVWVKKYREARESGISVGVISLPNWGTLERGARDFYAYIVDELGISGLQIYPPFPAGAARNLVPRLPLDNRLLIRFYEDLIAVWMEEGYYNGIDIAPFTSILDYFLTGDKSGLPCEMTPNCAERYFACDPRGNVMLCDTWTSFPSFWYGSIFDSTGFSTLMNSQSAKALKQRPRRLIEQGECIGCRYLAICHGGCPARALSTSQTLYAKDPYCESIKALFECVEHAAFNSHSAPL
jgi:uncharacterized protein